MSNPSGRAARTCSMDMRTIAALALAAGLLTGCGSDAADAPTGTAGASGTTATSSESADLVIVISDFAFELPGPVPAGATITVRNEDGVGHTVTSDDDGATFDVAVGPGEEATLTVPQEAGDYPFHCRPHPAMTATLVVEG